MRRIAGSLLLMASVLGLMGCQTCDVCDDCGDGGGYYGVGDCASCDGQATGQSARIELSPAPVHSTETQN